MQVCGMRGGSNGAVEVCCLFYFPVGPIAGHGKADRKEEIV